MATGHLGMSTIHAESVEAVINRLESEPMNIPKSLIAMTNVIMVMSRTEIDGRPARRAKTMAEIVEFDREKQNIVTKEVFCWNPKDDEYVFKGPSPIMEKHRLKTGVSDENVALELHRRKTVLDWMVSQGIRRYVDVANVIREYCANSTRVFQKARVGLK